MSVRTGQYIVIEGNDGTGKSTQIDLLAQYLKSLGEDVCVIEEPGSDNPLKSTLVANYLRSIIKDGTIQRDPEINLALFSAARRELWFQKIKPALDDGMIVLASRNYFSTIAYQGYGQEIDIDHINQITSDFTDVRYMIPDCAIILSISNASERKKRIDMRGELASPDTFESLDDSFQSRVNRGYLAIAKENELPLVECISASGHQKTKDEIAAEIRAIVKQSCGL